MWQIISALFGNLVYDLLKMAATAFLPFLIARWRGWLKTNAEAIWAWVAVSTFLGLALFFVGSETNSPRFRIVPVKLGLATNPRFPDSVAVLLGLNVFNNGRDSVATDWTLTISAPGEFADKSTKSLTVPDKLKFADPSSGNVEIYKRADSLADRTTEPIRRGGLVPGILFFRAENTKLESLVRPDTAYTLGWKDSEGTLASFTFHAGDLPLIPTSAEFLEQPGVPEEHEKTSVISSSPPAATASPSPVP